jgi:hypothetical protein
VTSTKVDCNCLTSFRRETIAFFLLVTVFHFRQFLFCLFHQCLGPQPSRISASRQNFGNLLRRLLSTTGRGGSIRTSRLPEPFPDSDKKRWLARSGAESCIALETVPGWRQSQPRSRLARFRASYFFAALNFAHLARCAAAILFLPAAEIVRLGFGARPFAFAHRAFCARLIRLRAAANMVPLSFV